MYTTKISIFLPYYNDEKFIGQAVKACFDQTFTDWELILFNHASTDQSSIIVQSIEDKRIKHIRSEENLGAGSGKNLADCLKYMSGKYVKLLCADDAMNPDCLEKLYAYMEAHPEKDMCFSDMEYVDKDGRSLETQWSKEIPKVDFENDELKTLKIMFHGQSHLAYPSSFVKRSVLQNIKLNVTYIMIFDVFLWTRLLINGHKLGFIPEPLIRYRCHSSQMSSVANFNIAVRRGYLEYSAFCEEYFRIKDVAVAKYLVDTDFASQLMENDVDLIPFVIAHHFLTAHLHPEHFPSGPEPFRLCGFRKINEMLNDNVLAAKIKKRFNYGIREFREFYSTPEDHIKKIGSPPKNLLSFYK